MRLMMNDAQQQGFEFLVSQSTHIETAVYKKQYPEIQYPFLIPVDTSADPWAPSITFFSMDEVGAAEWLNHMATNMPAADVTKEKFEQSLYMAGIGYYYTLEELGRARLAGRSLTSERADAARASYERFVDSRAFLGDTVKNWTGLVNNDNVTRVDAPNDGTGASRLWSDKTADQILRDINDNLTAVWTSTNTIETADTVLLPNAAWTALGTTRIPSTSITAWEFVMKNNAYTMKSGQPLTIRSVIGLDHAGSGGVGRMVVYRRDPSVVKMHIPMVHQFLPPWQTTPIRFDVPGIFRMGPVEIRRRSAFRYVDGITAA